MKRSNRTSQEQYDKLLDEQNVHNGIDSFGRPLDILFPIYTQHIKERRSQMPGGRPFNAFYIKDVQDLPFLVQLLNKQVQGDTQAEIFIRTRSATMQHVVLVHYQKQDTQHQYAIMEPAYEMLWSRSGSASYPNALLTHAIINAIKKGLTAESYSESEIYVIDKTIQKSAKGCAEIALATAEYASSNKNFMAEISRNRREFIEPERFGIADPIRDSRVFAIDPGSYPPMFPDFQVENHHHPLLLNKTLLQERKKIAAILPQNEDISFQEEKLRTVIASCTGKTLYAEAAAVNKGAVPPIIQEIRLLSPYIPCIAGKQVPAIALIMKEYYPEIVATLKKIFPGNVSSNHEGSTIIFSSQPITKEAFNRAENEIQDFGAILEECNQFAVRDYTHSSRDLLQDFKEVYKKLYAKDIPASELGAVNAIVTSPQKKQWISARDNTPIPYKNAKLYEKYLHNKIREIAEEPSMAPANNLTIQAILTVLRNHIFQERERSSLPVTAVSGALNSSGISTAKLDIVQQTSQYKK